ncbi:hypothetical protein MASR2M39_07870 [Ignavibacteriales bacterium]
MVKINIRITGNYSKILYIWTTNNSFNLARLQFMMTSILFLVSIIAATNLLFIIVSRIASNRRFAKEQLELARISAQTPKRVQEVNTTNEPIFTSNNPGRLNVHSGFKTSFQILNTVSQNIATRQSFNSTAENFR